MKKVAHLIILAAGLTGGGVLGRDHIDDSIPVITTDPKDAFEKADPQKTHQFKISAHAKGGPNFSLQYQWYFNGEPLMAETSDKLLVDLKKESVGHYYCVVSTESGVAKSHEASLTLYVESLINKLPVVTLFSAPPASAITPSTICAAGTGPYRLKFPQLNGAFVTRESGQLQYSATESNPNTTAVFYQGDKATEKGCALGKKVLVPKTNTSTKYVFFAYYSTTPPAVCELVLEGFKVP